MKLNRCLSYLMIGLILTPTLALADVPARPGVVRSNKVSRSMVRMRWKDKSVNERNFQIERKQPNDAGYRVRGVTDRNEVEFFDKIRPGYVYLYRVRATNSFGSSRPSPPCYVNRTPPSKPIDVNASILGLTRATITWADRSATENGFRIQRKVDGDRFRILAEVDKNVEEYEDTGLDSATTYTYRVRALGKPARCIKHSLWSEERMITTKGNTTILSVVLAGNGKGSVRSFPAGIDCAPNRNKCDAQFPLAEYVMVIPDARTSSYFLKWRGQSACDGVNGACVLYMGRDREIEAVFRLLGD